MCPIPRGNHLISHPTCVLISRGSVPKYPPFPQIRHQSTLLVVALVILPVVTAMPIPRGNLPIARGNLPIARENPLIPHWNPPIPCGNAPFPQMLSFSILVTLVSWCTCQYISFYSQFVINKLAKLGDAIAISKSETINDSLTHSDWQG